MSVKKVYLKKKIGNTIYDIFPKTSADVVEYDNTTVAETLANIATSISNITTESTGTIDTRIATAVDDLYNRIAGITTEDPQAVAAAYDTLKEIAAYIDSHGSVAAGFTSDISALKSTVGDSSSGLVKKVSDLETTVGDSSDGLVADVASLQSDVGDSSTPGTIIHRIGELEGTVGDSSDGLVADVATLQSDLGDSATPGTAIYRIGQLETEVGDNNTSGTIKKRITDLEKHEINFGTQIAGIQYELHDEDATPGTTVIYRIKQLEGAVGDSSDGLVADVASLQTAVGDNSDGLVADVASLQTAVGDSSSGLVADVATLQTAVGNSSSGLVHDVAAIPIVAASTTNGNIKINNQEVTVYSHPATISASTVTETTDKNFVTDSQLANINNIPVITVAQNTNNMTENDLYFVEIS